jgi:hypothetical protein
VKVFFFSQTFQSFCFLRVSPSCCKKYIWPGNEGVTKKHWPNSGAVQNGVVLLWNSAVFQYGSGPLRQGVSEAVGKRGSG